MMKIILFLILFQIGCSHSNKKFTYEFYSTSKGLSFYRLTHFSNEINSSDKEKILNIENILLTSPKAIKIGIIEYSATTKTDFRYKVISKKFGNPQQGYAEYHANQVIESVSEVDFNKKVVIYNCGLEDLAFIKECLVWLKDNEVQGINISIGIPYLIGNDGEIFKKMMKEGIIITMASGNEGRVVSGICREFLDLICVGLLDESGTRSIISNYGPYVSAWEKGAKVVEIQKHQDGDETKTIDVGTSFSSPRYLAKVLKQKYDKNGE